MEKAFDLKVLAARLQEAGLPEAELLAEKVYSVLAGWLNDSVALQDNYLLKALLPVLLNAVDPLVKEQLDKIDGKAG